LANAGLGVVHGLAGPLGGETGAPHGAICARLLPHALTALDRAAGKPPALATRLAAVTALIDEIVPGGVSAMPSWLSSHGVARLGALSDDARARVAEAAASSSSMKTSPVTLPSETLERMLADAGGG
jgi:alcohol dehydrogenase class IV